MKQFKKIHVPDELAEHYEVAINPELQLQRAVTGFVEYVPVAAESS
jgi:hypothetical protein